MKYSVSAQSHVGLVRSQNEDMILISNRFLRDESYEIQLHADEYSGNILFALADGMGGHNAGEVASEETLHHLSAFFNSLPSGLTPEGLQQAFTAWIWQAHTHLKQKGDAYPELFNMGTTLVGLCLYEGRAYSFNCGDSCIYLMRSDKLKRLSEDHTYDRITGRKEHSHILTNCVGCGQSIFLDFKPLLDAPSAGDTFLLCSDGLTDLVSDEQLARFLRAGSTAPVLIRMALHAGGRDNVSACLIRFGY